MLKITYGIALFSLCCSTYSSPLLDHPSPLMLVPDVEYECCSREVLPLHRQSPIIYCFLGIQRSLLHTWLSAKVYIDLISDNYDLYVGKDDWEVRAEFESRQSSWNFNIYNWRQKYIKLHPFNSTCIGILAKEDCILTLRIEHLDKQLVGMFIAGIVLFFISPVLTNNPLFYYTSGIIIGVFTSVLVLLYIILKLLPLKKPAMFGMMAGGSTIMLYFYQTIYNTIILLAFSYRKFVFCYFLISALISFVVCYRFGPITDPRSKNLIRWTLQAISLQLIFFSSYAYEVTFTSICIVLILHYIPLFRWSVKTFTLRKSAVRCKNEQGLMNCGVKQRYLTEREYNLQGQRETKQGLEELRMFYVKSPNNFRLDIVRRLQNPYKFSQFLRGKPHISPEELKKKREEDLMTDDSEYE